MWPFEYKIRAGICKKSAAPKLYCKENYIRNWIYNYVEKNMYILYFSIGIKLLKNCIYTWMHIHMYIYIQCVYMYVNSHLVYLRNHNQNLEKWFILRNVLLSQHELTILSL